MLVVVAFLVLTSVSFTAVTLTVGDPFYERIWRATETMLGGEVPESGLSFWRSAADSLVLVLVGLLTAVGVFVVGLLPVVGAVIGAVAGLAISGRLLAGELLARPLEARGMDRHARREALRAHRSTVLGFGMSTQLCFLVPLRRRRGHAGRRRRRHAARPRGAGGAGAARAGPLLSRTGVSAVRMPFPAPRADRICR